MKALSFVCSFLALRKTPIQQQILNQILVEKRQKFKKHENFYFEIFWSGRNTIPATANCVVWGLESDGMKQPVTLSCGRVCVVCHGASTMQYCVIHARLSSCHAHSDTSISSASRLADAPHSLASVPDSAVSVVDLGEAEDRFSDFWSLHSELSQSMQLLRPVSFTLALASTCNSRCAQHSFGRAQQPPQLTCCIFKR